MHVHKVGMVVYVAHYAAGGGVVLQVVQYPVHLIHLSFFIAVLYAQLIAVCLAYTAALIRPGVPDMAVQVIYVVGLFLPYPKEFVHSVFKSGFPKGHNGKLF